ncbi:MAG: rod shape-determining protein MreC [bacterium]|nr:rod shape-determining protein MreC [bacterium]
MLRRPAEVSTNVAWAVLVVCVGLSILLLSLPKENSIRVADRLGLILTSPYWQVRNFGEDVLRTRDENTLLQERILSLELMAQANERMVRDAGRMAGPALDVGFSGELVPCRVIKRQRSRFATMIKIQSLEPVAWQPWQPVLSGKGYLGRLRTVINDHEAWVELLSAPDFALGIEIDRTGLLGVLHPRSGRFVVDMVGRDEDVKVGDLIITSGIAEVREQAAENRDSSTLRGFPVGVVSQVSSPSEMIFKEIIVQPTAQFEYNETVFVVVPFFSETPPEEGQVPAP